MLFNPYLEKRLHPRFYCSLKACLNNSINVTVADISAGGILLRAEKPIQKENLSIHIPEIKPDGTFRSRLRVVRQHNNELGCSFEGVSESDKAQLENFIRAYLFLAYKKEKTFADFKLFINGKDVDTGQYEYCPYSEKAITDFKTTRKIILKLKKGLRPEGCHDYVYARYCVGSEKENEEAIEAAYHAQKEFQSFSLSRRRKILGDIHDLLREKKEQLIHLMVLEGHPLRLAQWELDGMSKETCHEKLDYYASEIFKKVGCTSDEDLFLIRKPDGICCVSTPKNASSSVSLAASFALLGGNTLIVKPPLKNPVSTIFLWRNIVGEALKANGAPPGTVNIIIGNSENIMKQWIESKQVNTIIYFGQSKKGLEIGKSIFHAEKKPILELSGNDFLIVWKDAPIQEAAQSLLEGFLGSSQICMIPKKALIHQEIFEPFKDEFLKQVKTLKVGLPHDPDTLLSPVTKMDEFYEFLNEAIEKKAKVLCGGNRVDYRGQKDDNGFFLEPTVLEIEDQQAGGLRCVEEENFFPLIPLIKVTGKDSNEHITQDPDVIIFNKIIRLANNNQYGLRCSVWTSSKSYQQKFLTSIHNCGILRINSSHAGFSPYLSGLGGTRRSGGPFGEMNYVWQKTTHLQGVSVKKLT